MTETATPPVNRSKAALKAGIFIAFIIGAILLVRYTPVKNYLTAPAMAPNHT